MADPGEGPRGPGPPLFLDQTEAQRDEKCVFKNRPPPLSPGLDDRPPLLPSEGLDPQLILFFQKRYQFFYSPSPPPPLRPLMTSVIVPFTRARKNVL